ncbi:MAG: hypothetical protein WC378_07765 [Opitutaceae bacterium]|jgi:purine-cytosine permease-like protein
MKTEAISYALITVVVAGALGLLVGLAYFNGEASSLVGWAAAGVLLAMTAIEGRKYGKGLLGHR